MTKGIIIKQNFMPKEKKIEGLPNWKKQPIKRRLPGGICCPSCGLDDTSVYDSRPSVGTIRRNRVCKKRFTTYETTAAPLNQKDVLNRVIKHLRQCADEIQFFLGG